MVAAKVEKKGKSKDPFDNPRCKYLRPDQFAEYFGISTQTVYRMFERKEIKAVQFMKRMCIPKAEVAKIEATMNGKAKSIKAAKKSKQNGVQKKKAKKKVRARKRSKASSNDALFHPLEA